MVAKQEVSRPYRADGCQLRLSHRDRVAARGAASLSRRVLEWAGARLGTPLSVEDLAAHLRVSPRTLARRFAEQVGTSPGAWLLSRRIAEARVLLAESDLAVEAIAARVGLGSAVNLRRRFRAHVGTTPGAYRRAFRESDQPCRVRRVVVRWKRERVRLTEAAGAGGG